MPTYEYVCTACGNDWEEIQKISEAPVKACPKCGKSTAKRQISGGNFILKGGGWYADAYSSAKPASKNDGSKKDGSKRDGGAEPKGEPKAEPAAPTPAPETKKDTSSSSSVSPSSKSPAAA